MNTLFTPRNATWYARIMHTSPIRRYLYSFALCAALAAAWFYGVYKPLESQAAHYETEIAQLQTQQLAALKSRNMSAQLSTAIDVVRTSLKGYSCALDASSQIPDLIVLANQSGLAVQGCTIDKEQELSGCASDAINAEFSGEFDAVLRFFTALGKAHLLFDVENISLSSVENNQFKVVCSAKLMTIKQS